MSNVGTIFDGSSARSFSSTPLFTVIQLSLPTLVLANSSRITLHSEQVGILLQVSEWFSKMSLCPYRCKFRVRGYFSTLRKSQHRRQLYVLPLDVLHLSLSFLYTTDLDRPIFAFCVPSVNHTYTSVSHLRTISVRCFWADVLIHWIILELKF